MKSIFKRSLFIVLICILANVCFAQVQSFNAAEIKNGTTKGAVSVSTTLSVVNKQMCKENGKGVKIDAIEGGSTANTVNDNYVQISASSDISKLVLHATYNSSGSGKKMAFVYWGEGATPAIDNVLSAELVTFVGYDGDCDKNYAEVTLPSGVRTIRIYRQLKKFDGTGSSSSNYGDGTTFFIADIDVTAGPAPASADATLKSLTYDGTSVPNFSASTTEYDVELPAGTTVVPVVAAETNDAAAKAVVTQADKLPGVAKVEVTAEDGTTKKVYQITFTKETANPKVESATWANIRGTANIDNVNMTITGQVLNGSSLVLEPQFKGKYLDSWTPTGAQDFSKGSIDYTFSSATSEKTKYTVTITEAPAMSSDATLKSLTYGGQSVPNFSPTTYVYNIELTAGIKTPPAIAAVANDAKATVQITQATSVPGVGKVLVTAEDVTVTQTYTINYTVVVPPSGLTTHVPEIYEGRLSDGGYATPLVNYNSREYEVFYAGRLDEGGTKLTIHTVPADKSRGITKNESSSSCEAIDGWFKCAGGDKGTGFAVKDEFNKATERCHVMNNSQTDELHIKGFDQFSLYAMDKKVNPSKPTDNKVFQVFIDGVEQAMELNQSATIRRFDIASGEHVIKIVSGGDGCLLGGFSLRVAQEPRLKYLKGNDSAQVVMQTTAIKPITYSTKYNNIAGAETKLVWDGAEATGIDLAKIEGAIADTFKVSGNANCPVGEYKYSVVATFNGIETSRAKGTFKVASDICSMTDIKVTVYQNEEMDQIIFAYHALSGNDVKLEWPSGKPQGTVDGKGDNGKYIIGGTPTNTGDFPFEVSVLGADTVIKGLITVKPLDYGNNPVLYLCKHTNEAPKEGIYNYLKKDNKWNPIERRGKNDGLRPADQYAHYKWILIAEDADANNEEVKAIIRGGSNLPVLNMNAFSYAYIESSDMPNGWGEPDNGSLTDEGRFITVQREDHPIFKALNKKRGDKIQVLDTVDHKGLMPVNIFPNGGTLCLATALMRNDTDYYGDGKPQTFLHEIPAAVRGGKKYICMPIAQNSSNRLHANGKKLIDAVINYLLSNEATIDPPVTQITKFMIDDIKGTISQVDKTIKFEIDLTEHPTFDVKAVQPIVTLASDYTFVTPNSGEEIDFSTSTILPIEYVVSDYINRTTYKVSVRTYTSEGLEEVYAVGDWVNIYDIFGRKIATTNENIYTMSLPRGIYIIVTDAGHTLKITR